jgi:hypothetical protein
MLTLVKIIHAVDSSPSRMAAAFFEAERFVDDDAVSTRRFAQQRPASIAPSNVSILVKNGGFIRGW